MLNVTIHNLYYIHDPMCSWCWAFHPVWQRLQLELQHQRQLQQLQQRPTASIAVRYLLGGLAADTESVMPLSMQQQIQAHWQAIIQRVKGTQFNFDFWHKCIPKRSTYPACRAVIAAKLQGLVYERAMIFAIQQAYYLQAKNPSDDAVLIDIAAQLSLDVDQFRLDLCAADTHRQLMQDIELSRSMPCSGFPSLILNANGVNYVIKIDYNQMEPMLKQIEAVQDHEKL